MTDRMDCQFIMGSIAFFYYSSFIAIYHTTVGGVIEAAVTGLSAEEQMEVVKILAKNLVNQDIISPKVGPHSSEYISYPANVTQILEYLSEQLHRR